MQTAVQSPSAVRGAILALYGTGAFAASVLLQTVLLWLVYFYAPPAGQGVTRLPPTLIGFALAAGRVVNALSNPPVAFCSDRWRTPWGRRRPFIAIGAPGLAACFALLWAPPAAGQGAVFTYTVLALAGFFFLFSVVMNPYAAMLPEITPGGAGRAPAASWQAGGSLAGVGIAMVATPWLIDHWGFPTMGTILGIFALACYWILGGSMPASHVPVDTETGAAPRGFWREVAGVLHNRSFQIYLGALALLWLGTSMVNTTVVYVVTVLMGLPREQVSVVLGAAFAVTLLALAPLARIIRTVGTVRALAWTLAAVTIVVPLIAGIGLRGAPFNAATQGYTLIVLSAGPLAALLVLPNVLVADIAEADHAATGQGREAMFYAVQGLVLNIATAAASAILGIVLSLGYATGHPLGLRLIPLLAGACTFFAFVIFRSYPRTVPAGDSSLTDRAA